MMLRRRSLPEIANAVMFAVTLALAAGLAAAFLYEFRAAMGAW